MAVPEAVPTASTFRITPPSAIQGHPWMQGRLKEIQKGRTGPKGYRRTGKHSKLKIIQVG